MDSINVMKVSQEAVLPTRAHPDDAGLDLYSLEDVLLTSSQNATIQGQPNGKVIRTGIAISLPIGYVGLVADRSSLAKKGIKCAGGVIDSGYRGEIHIVLWNISNQEIRLNRGDRIAQLLILPVITPAVKEVPELDTTQRGEKGFGSSGQ